MNENFDCVLCGAPDNGNGIGGWSVMRKLWVDTMGSNDKDMICIACFEKKLGRKLTSKDFTATTDNHTNENVLKIFNEEGFSNKAGWKIIASYVWPPTFKEVWNH